MSARENGIHLEFGWTEMEELLQCPVCFDLPANGQVEQCVFGHHICSTCRSQVSNCPFCKKGYQGTRNFVIEELMKNREYIKNVMELTAITQNANPLKKPKLKKAVTLQVPVKPKCMRTPEATRGLYPCGFSCDVKLPSCRLLNHARSFHANFLVEASLNANNQYTTSFTLNCVIKKNNTYTWQRAFFIKGMGLVYFTYELIPVGYLIMTVTMAAQWRLTQKYKAQIKLSSERMHYTHTAKVVPTRYKMENILFNNACLLLDNRQIKNVASNKTIKCQLELSLYATTDVLGSSYIRPNITSQISEFYRGRKM